MIGGCKLLRASMALVIAQAFVPSLAGAADWGSSVSVGYLHTDNLLRQDPKVTGDIATAQFSLLSHVQTRTAYADVSAGLTVRRYGIADVSDDVLPGLNAVAQWNLSPDRFAWIVTDNFGQRAYSSNDSLVPADRENVNVFSTGPEFRHPVWSGSYVTAAARFGRVDYQESPFDNNRFAARAGLENELDSGALWTVDVSGSRTNYSGELGHYSVNTLSTGYRSHSTRGGIDANLGVTHLNDMLGSHSGVYMDLRFERNLTRRLSVSVDAVNRFGDTADVFTRLQGLEPGVDSSVNINSSGGALRDRSLTSSVGWEGRRTRVTFGASYLSQIYYAGGVDAKRSAYVASADVEFRMTPRMFLEMRAERQWEAPEFERTLLLDQEHLSLAWAATRSLELRVGVERFARTNSTQDYREVRYSASVLWHVHRLDAQQRPPGLDTAARRRIALPR